MFNYTIDPNADVPIMLLCKQIGNTNNEEGYVVDYGVCGEDFAREILQHDANGKKEIQIWINSIGGSVMEGYTIFAAILQSKCKVNTFNIGVAASTAGWIFQAGRERTMNDYATWMGHNPSSSDGSDSEILKKFRDSIITMISQRTGMSFEEVSKMLDKETYLTASECLGLNFCDTITATSQQNRKRMSAAANVTDKYKEALAISNIVLPTTTNNNNSVKTTTTMADVNNTLDINITNALGIVKEASPAMVVKEISQIQNALVIEQGKVTDLTKQLGIVNSAKSDLQAKYDDLVNEMNKIKSAMEEEDCKNREKAATEMVNGFAQAGKIKNDAETIKKWVDRAKVSAAECEEIKNLLNDLPVNKEAKKWK